MRLMLVPLFLLMAPQAEDAPPFPLEFEGESCTLVGNCRPMIHQVHADGTLIELISGISGQYTYDPATRRYLAAYNDLAATSFDGTKLGGQQCVEGFTRNLANFRGTFSMCLVVN